MRKDTDVAKKLHWERERGGRASDGVERTVLGADSLSSLEGSQQIHAYK